MPLTIEVCLVNTLVFWKLTDANSLVSLEKDKFKIFSMLSDQIFVFRKTIVVRKFIEDIRQEAVKWRHCTKMAKKLQERKLRRFVANIHPIARRFYWAYDCYCLLIFFFFFFFLATCLISPGWQNRLECRYHFQNSSNRAHYIALTQTRTICITHDRYSTDFQANKDSICWLASRFS